MFRKSMIVSVVLALVVGACSSDSESPTVTRPSTTSSTTTSTTTTIPTTTTTVPFTLEGATPELNALVEAFYSYATAESTTPPAIVEPVLSMLQPAPADIPRTGTAAMATFKGSGVATAQIGEDLILAVDDGDGWRVVGGYWPSLGLGTYYGQGPRHVAVVGSDARTGQPVETSRADSIHFVALDGAGAGAVVGLPRDSYVPIPGHGRGKITGSLSLGGPDLMMQAFRDLTGLPFEGYVLTGFAGFQSLIDGVLSGVEVEVPFAINDKAAKAALSAGQQVLNGFDALAFARARKTLPGGDFDRSFHQGKLILGAANAVKSMGPMAIPGLMEGAEPSIFTNLTAEQLLTFSTMVIGSSLDRIPNLVAPGSAGRAGSASVVYLADSATSLFQDLADGQLNN